MKSETKTNILLAVIAAIIVMAMFISGVIDRPSQNASEQVGNYNPTAGGTYYLRNAIGDGDSTITLQSFDEPVSGIPYTMSYLNSSIEYGTLDPYSATHVELISFTGITQNNDGSATLTGVTRGLEGTYPYQASTTLESTHPTNAIFVLSNPPQLTNQYLNVAAGNTNTIYSLNVFSSTTPPQLDEPGAQANGTYISTTSEFATIAYVNKIAFSGAPNATASVKGISQLATARQAASSTALGSTGASLILPASIATDTPQNCSTAANGGCVVMSLLNGKISQSWLDLTQAFTFSGLGTFTNGLISNNATSTNTWITGIAGGSLLKVNTNGQVVAAVAGTDYPSKRYNYATTTPITIAGGSSNPTYQASTFFTIPSGVMLASSTIEVTVIGNGGTGGNSTGGACSVGVFVNNVAMGTTTPVSMSSNGTAGAGWVTYSITDAASTASQNIFIRGINAVSTGSPSPISSISSASANVSGAVPVEINFEAGSGSGGSGQSCTFGGYSITVTP